jgi:murein DD-endopeptidase MepM/ murein hydrolase activator NlpD
LRGSALFPHEEPPPHFVGNPLLSNGLIPALGKHLQHRNARLTAFLAALAVSAGGGAFALASMAPDAANLPVHQVTESVQVAIQSGAVTPQTLLASDAAVASVADQALVLYRSDQSRSNDSAEALLARLGVSDAVAAAFLRKDGLTRKNLLGRAGRNITAETSAANGLLKLTARWAAQDDANFTRLVVQKDALGFTSTLQTAPLVASTRLASGSISSSLFAATDEAGLPDSIGSQVAEIFSGDIDFHRALRKGDRFSITYEALEADGEPMRAGRVLSAEFVNNGKKFQAMWFGKTGEKGGAYYTLDGNSLRRAFLASPLEFSRVTRGFKMRMHPILQTWKQHLGVDYAAPIGTAVRSIGDGVVEFAGVQRGFGNVVIVNHGKTNSTVYAHLSKINVHKGEKISQSQNIGAVGTTGWSTGPHLHFEFRVNGVHQDPLTMARQAETQPVSAELKPRFEGVASQVRVALAAAATVQRGTAD